MGKIKPYAVRRCIVKDSDKIRKLLIERFKELGLTNRKIVDDSESLNYHISYYALSKYLNRGNTLGTLSQIDIIWLCFRYGVDISLVSSKNTPYDENECLKHLKSHFE